jgi:excisionase family DNA binding protein
MIGVSEAAARLEVSRTTVYDWVGKKTLLGWKSTKRGLTIPAEQILDPGKVVPGIAQVLEIIDDPELAWAFLSEEWPFSDKAVRPIHKLKTGGIEEVVNAAPSFGTAFT